MPNESRPERLAVSILTEAEQQALTLAENLYGADAKTQAAQFISTLGIAADQAEQAVGSIGAAIDEIVDFEQKKEIAGHFRALNQTLGESATKRTLQVE